MRKLFLKFTSVRMKLAGTVLVLTMPAVLFMYIFDLPMSGFVAGFLALVAAWMGGELFVRRQVQAMSQTARKIADGDFAARTGLPASRDEIGQLSKIFDRMAESLQQRIAERDRTEKTLQDRAAQQTVVAALGQFALTNNDLDGLMNQAVLLVAEALGVEFAAVFKRLPDGQLLLQSGKGWNPGQIGSFKLPADNHTQMDFTLGSGEPVIVPDLKADKRFETSRLLIEHGIASEATVVIRTRGEAFGVLSVHTKRRREFTTDELQFLIAVAGCIGMTADHLNLEEQLRHSQKMESIGQLAAGIAHDFNNMLTIIQGHSSVLLTKTSLPSEMSDPVQAIYFAAERAAALTRQLLMFSRKNVMRPRMLDLRENVANLTRMLGRLLGESVTLQFQPPARLPSVLGDSGMLEQVVMNLAVNARDAMPNGGVLTINLEDVLVDDIYVERHPQARVGDFVRLRVSDTGTGMDIVTLGRIFEPFFTTKAAGKGTGLGLATVYGIVKQHEGWIEVTSEPGKGSTFDVFLPVNEGIAIPEKAETPDASVAGGNETILIVEDEEILREMSCSILKELGYQILEAGNGKDALEVWHKSPDEIDLVFTDVLMPGGVSGVDLAEKLLADRPDLKIILTSGCSSDEINNEVLTRSQARFLPKPFTHDTLAKAVRESLAQTAAVES